MDKPPVILLTFANDRLDGHQYLRNLPLELKAIRKALEGVVEAGLCEIVERTNATLEEIVDLFQNKAYRDRIALFHFGGHAGSYKLLLESVEGSTVPIKSEGFNHFLGSCSSLKLVFLNACSTEFQAKELNRLGVPLVIGTSQAIRDQIACQLATRFYKGLGEGISLEQAWLDAQNEIIAKTGTANFRGLYSRQNQRVPDQLPWILHKKLGISNTMNWNLPEFTDNPLFGLPEIPDKYFFRLPQAPFIHLQHFTSDHAAIFYGRGKAIRNIYNKIRGPYPVILYYGQSGVGKSSLLQAGLLPRLEKIYLAVYLRRSEQVGLWGTVKQAIDTLAKEINPNWRDEEKAFPQIIQELEAHQKRPLIFILDQAEETFTKPMEAKTSREEIDIFVQKLEELYSNVTSIVSTKIILAYRNEYHSRIEFVMEEASLPFTKLDLQPLSRSGIIEAITGITTHPFTQDKYQLIIEENTNGNLSEIIANDLLEDKNSAIAPVLQVLLAKLWQRAEKQDRQTFFSLELYYKLKKEGLLLHDFFYQQVEKIRSLREKEVGSGFLLDFLYYHTTEMGTAAARSKEELILRYNHRKDLLPVLTQICIDHYLIIPTEADSLSLSHDTLAPIIRKEYKNSDLPGIRATRILANKTAGGNRNAFLDKVDLKIVETGLVGRRNLTTAEQQLIQRSREVRNRQQRRARTRRILAFGAVISILVFALTTLFLWQNTERRRITTEALFLTAKAREIYPENYILGIGLLKKAYKLEREDSHLAVIQSFYQLFYDLILNKRHLPVEELRHENDIMGARITQDEKAILSWYEDGIIKLWQVDGTLLAEMKHENTVHGAIFTKDEQAILSWSYDGIVKLWKHDATIIAEMKHEGAVQGASFTQDEKAILSWSKDGTVKFWHIDGTLLAEMKHKGWVQGALFTQDEQAILSWSGDGPIRLWQVDGTLIAEMNQDDFINKVVFTQDEQVIIACSGETVKLWQGNGTPLTEINHEGSINEAIFTQDEKVIMTCSGETIKLWQRDGTPLAEMKHSSPVVNARFTQDGQTVLSWSGNLAYRQGTGEVKLWQVDGNFLAEMKHERPVSGALFSNDEQSILSWSIDGTIKLWQDDGILLAEINHEEAVRGAMFTQDEQAILSWSGDYQSSNGTVRLWRVDGTLLAEMKHEGPVHEAMFIQDEKTILSWSSDYTSFGSNKVNSGGTIRLWSLEETIWSVVHHSGPINGAQFTKDEQAVLSWSGDHGSDDGTVKFWQRDGSLIGEMKHKGAVKGALFTQDEQTILSWSGRFLSWFEQSWIDEQGPPVATVKLWQPDGSLLNEMEHKGVVYGAIFTKDEQAVLSWSGVNSYNSTEGTVKLWQRDGTLLAKMNHESPVYGAMFTKDEQAILSWSGDYQSPNGTVKLWQVDGTLLAEMKHDGVVEGALFTQDEKNILSWSGDYTFFGVDDWSAEGTIKLWQRDGTLLVEMKHKGPIQGVQLTKDEQTILSWSGPSSVNNFDGEAKLWQEDGTLITEMDLWGYTNGALFSSDEQTTLSWGGPRITISKRDGTILTELKNIGVVIGAKFIHDEQALLTWGDIGQLWRRDGTLLAKMQQDGSINGIQLSRDRQTILAWTEGGEARLWPRVERIYTWLKEKKLAEIPESDMKRYLEE